MNKIVGSKLHEILSVLIKKKGFFKDDFKESTDAILEDVSVAETNVKG